MGTVTADGNRNFSAEVTVPDVSPGVYYVLAISGNAEAGRATFEVAPSAGAVSAEQTAASSKSVSADLWNGLARQDQGVSAAVSSDQARPALPKGTAVTGAALTAIGFLALAGHLVLPARTGAKPRLR